MSEISLVKKFDGEICVPVLEYKRLKDTGIVEHCFSTRLGGVSSGIFESMNLSYSRGDDKAFVDENFRRIAAILNSAPERIICSNQTHTTNVMVVTEKNAGNGVTKPNEFKDVDGMVTNVPGIILATFYADCVPLYFVDTVNKAIGLSHSGWRGTVGRMGQKTIDVMGAHFGSRPQDLICAVGPSICADCYEISEDVADEFNREFPKQADRILKHKGNGKYHLDLWLTNKIILQESGVKEENIIMADMCTCCNKELLFSHRATAGKRGNLGAFLGLKCLR